MKQDNEAYNQAHGPGITPRPGGGPVRAVKSEAARRIECCVAYMMQHLNQPLQVAKLAETAHASSSHFFVLFKRWAGSSPIDYFIRLRMEQAGRLLATTSLSVKEIAADLGYDDPFYFSRVFKSVHGVAPSDYRQSLDQPARNESGRSLTAMLDANGENQRPRERGSVYSPQNPYMLQRG